MLTKDMSKENYVLTTLVEDNPHTLIAGTTGSGKSVCLNKILYSILKHNCLGLMDIAYKLAHKENVGPDANKQLIQFAFIDVKRVELRDYKDLRETKYYVTEPDDVPAMLDKVIDEMERRYTVMKGRKYNGEYFYVVIDELADLVNSENKKRNKEILARLVRIGRLGRAVNVKLLACTQDPSRETLSGPLMQNFPCRIALYCESDIDSRQIIGVSGAEKIDGYGKCIVRTRGLDNVEYGMVSDEDIAEVVNVHNQISEYVWKLIKRPSLFEVLTFAKRRAKMPIAFSPDYVESRFRAMDAVYDSLGTTHPVFEA